VGIWKQLAASGDAEMVGKMRHLERALVSISCSITKNQDNAAQHRDNITQHWRITQHQDSITQHSNQTLHCFEKTYFPL
jgi:hypothetical protein